MRSNIRKYTIIKIMLFVILLFSLTSCPKPPINPWDEEGLSLGLVTVSPEFQTAGGTYNKDITVTITCSDETAVIYYSTDGSDPDESSLLYNAPVVISGNDTNTIVKAIAANPNKVASHVEAESFRIEYFDLILSTGGNGTVSPEGTTAAAQDKLIQVSAVADSGYAFSHWAVVSSSDVIIDDIYSETTSVTLSSGSAEVSALFSPGTSLTMTDDSTGSTLPQGAVLVVEDVPRTIRAYADTGYIFKQWSVVSGSGVVFVDEYSAVTQVTLTDGVASIRADFEPLKYNLNISSGSGGSTSPGGITEVQHAIAQGITATELSGWVFSHWSIESGSGVSIADTANPSTTVTLTDGAAEIKANFVVERSLTIADDGNGSTNPSSGVIGIGDGMATSISASPDSGYGFSHWSTSGAASVADSASSSTTVVLSGGDGTVTANFTDNNYELTVQSGANGSVVPTGSLMVVHGVAQSISATPITAGYEFSSWSVLSGTASIADSSAAGTTATLTAGAATVQANFVLKTYYLTMDDDGFGSTSASRNATHGVDYGITATADSGYEFDSWSVTAGSAVVADTGSSATTVRLESGDATVKAIFTPLNYSLTISSDGNGTVNPSGLQTVSHAVQTVISATPTTAGYEFDSWSVESGIVTITNSSASSTTVTLLNGSATIKANFALETYALTMTDNGFGSTNTSTIVTYGVAHSITATPDTGYNFDTWTVTSGTADISNANSASTTVSLTNGPATLQANFSLKDYTLEITNDGNGTTAPAEAQTVSHAAATAISATPSTGYHFISWTVPSGTATFDDDTAASTNVTLTDGNATIQANFTINSYFLTIEDNGFGATTEGTTVDHGEIFSITATPDTGYNFDSWTITSGTASIANNTSASTTVTLTDGAASIQAIFTPKDYTLQINNDGNGTTTPTGSQTVSHAASTAVSASATSNFIFSSWTVTSGSGVTIDDDTAASTSITLTDGNAAVQANFLPTYILTVSSDGNGVTSPSGDTTVTSGISTAIQATPGTGYDFDTWTIISGSASIVDTGSGSTSVTLSSGDAEIRAIFVLKNYTLTVNNDVGGSTTPAGAVTVTHGISQAISTTAYTACEFSSWSVESGTGAVFGNENSASTTVTLSNGDAVIKANYSRWPQVDKLLNPDGAIDDDFGWSVSISGDYAIVGVPYDDDNGEQSGSAYIFFNNGTDWVQQAKLLAADGGMEFGFSVAISGDYAVVGSRRDQTNGTDAGAAYVFHRIDTSWSQQAKLLPSDGLTSALFGTSSAIDGDYIIVGSERSNSAYIFYRSGVTWSQQAILLATDGVAEDYFGQSVSISGEYAIAGAKGRDDAGDRSGGAYIFYRDGVTWSQQAKLSASDAAPVDLFGVSVSISGDYSIVGSYWDDDFGTGSGSAYIYKRDGTSWTETQKLLPSDGNSATYFGKSVSIDGDKLVVGCPNDNDNGNFSGSAYVFQKVDTDWIEQVKLLPDDGITQDFFAESVSVNGGNVISGKRFESSRTGSAYIFGE